jgi:hypothetical protein
MVVTNGTKLIMVEFKRWLNNNGLEFPVQKDQYNEDYTFVKLFYQFTNIYWKDYKYEVGFEYDSNGKPSKTSYLRQPYSAKVISFFNRNRFSWKFLRDFTNRYQVSTHWMFTKNGKHIWIK